MIPGIVAGQMQGALSPSVDVIEYIAAATGDSGAASSMSISVPSGTADGDYLVAYIFNSNPGVAINTPAGWTNVYDNAASYNRVSIFVRTAISEPSSYTFTAGSGVYFSGIMACFRPSAGKTPAVQIGDIFRSVSSSGEPYNALSLDSTLAGIVTVFSGNEYNTNTTCTVSGMTSAGSRLGGFRNCALFREAASGAGPTGTRSVNWAHGSVGAPRIIVKVCAS